MDINIVCDTYLHYIVLLRNELEEVQEKVNTKYKNVKNPKTIGVAFRCLPEEIGRKTFRRYTKDKYLTLDITTSYEAYQKKFKAEIRHDLGHLFFNTLEDALKKYRFEEIPTEDFLADIKRWCKEIGWLQDEVDYAGDDIEYPAG